MGKGDIKSKKGKRWKGSFGKHRPKRGASSFSAPIAAVEKKQAAPKKTTKKKKVIE